MDNTDQLRARGNIPMKEDLENAGAPTTVRATATNKGVLRKVNDCSYLQLALRT